MRCQNCGTDIPSAWAFVISQNLCPACGGALMGDSAKELMASLAEAMEKMPNDPQGVAGWLVSNYRFQKIGSEDPPEVFHRARARGEVADERSLKVDDSYNRFLSRTDMAGKVQSTMTSDAVRKLAGVKDKRMQALAQNIQDIDDPYEDQAPKNSSSDVSEEDMAMYNEMKKAGVDPFGASDAAMMTAAKNKGIIRTAAPSFDYDEDEHEPMSAIAEELLPQEQLLAQSAEGMAVVKQNRFKRIKAQQALLGGGGGMFSRAG